MVTGMTETLIGYDIHASFDGANQFQAANIERRYRVTTDDGTYERRARGVIADLASVVPSSDLMEQVTALTASLATMTADRDAQKAAKEAAEAQIASAQAAIDKTQPTVANLLRYVGQVRQQRAAAGVTVNGIAVATDPDSLVLLAGSVQLCQINPSTTIQWHISGNGSVSLTAQQVIGLGVAVGEYIQAGFATVANLAAGIQAYPPTITTFEQIDNATWPSAILAS